MTAIAATEETVRGWLAEVADPEVPVLSVLDLGVVRAVHIDAEGTITVTITPTYSGCPAMDIIAMQIRMVLAAHGVKTVRIEQQLSPAWTTDWMTADGKRKLQEYGIAPPQYSSKRALGLFEDDNVPCPRCGSLNTQLVSQFGATSCKAQHRCLSCYEPFEHFKCH